jgi:hypothetical protein
MMIGMDAGKKKTSMVPRKNNEAWLRVLEMRGTGPSTVHNNISNTVPLQISGLSSEVVAIDKCSNENQRSGSIPEASSPKRTRVQDVAHIPSDYVSFDVHPRLLNFLQDTSRAIREPERNRLEIGSQRKVVEKSFISSVEVTPLFIYLFIYFYFFE